MNHVICINKLGISLIIKCLEIKPLMYKTEQSWKSSEISLWQIILINIRQNFLMYQIILNVHFSFISSFLETQMIGLTKWKD